MPTYLYGLILTRNAERVPTDVVGIDQAPVRVVVCDTLAALVSTIDALPARQNLEALAAHDRATWMVARAAVTAAASRFGQAFSDDRTLCRELATFTARLVDTLTRYDGYGEMRIVMTAPAPPAPPDTTGGARPARVASHDAPGRAYLESIRETMPRPPVDFRGLLGDVVAEERVERRGGLQTISHLVRFENQQRYRTALDVHPALSGAALTGPHALYSFAEPD